MTHAAEQTITIMRGGSDYAHVTLQGHLDHHAAQRLRTQLDAVLETGARYLTVDLSDVNCCGQNVLDLLCWAERRASLQRGWLVLTGTQRHIRFAAHRSLLLAVRDQSQRL